MFDGNNFQRHPLLLMPVSRKPDRGEPASTESVHNLVPSAVVHVAQVNSMEPPWPVFFDIFRVDANALGGEETQVFIVGLLRRCHFGTRVYCILKRTAAVRRQKQRET